MSNITLPPSRQAFNATLEQLRAIRDASPTAYKAITLLENAIVDAKLAVNEEGTDPEWIDQWLRLQVLIAVYELMKKEG